MLQKRILRKRVIFNYMTIAETYKDQIRVCLAKGLRYDSGHYKTNIDFKGKEVYVSPDGEDVIRYVFNITGCLKTRVIKKNGKVVKVLHFHKDKLPVYGTITKSKTLKGFLYKYLLFLRCDGIEDNELLKLYVLHCLSHKFEFWRKDKIKFEDWVCYEPDYADVEKMIEGLLQSAIKKQIDDETRKQFQVQSCCVVNPEVIDNNGGIRNKTRWEKRSDAKRGQRLATDNRIKAIYDHLLKDEELAEKAGVSVRRIQEWKADNRDSLESLKDRIDRMYDRSLSKKKNAAIIGCCLNTLKKYLSMMKEEIVSPPETDDAWIDAVLEEESSFWKDVPEAKRKNSDEYDEFDDIWKQLEDIE